MSFDNEMRDAYDKLFSIENFDDEDVNEYLEYIMIIMDRLIASHRVLKEQVDSIIKDINSEKKALDPKFKNMLKEMLDKDPPNSYI